MNIPRFGQTYYYVAGTTPLGKPFFYGPFMNESEARSWAFEKAQNLLDMDITQSKHKDLRRAQSEYRPRVFEQTGDMDAALQRIKHDPKTI